MAVVTGGTRNIGLAVARGLSQAGATGVVLGRRGGEHLTSIADELSHEDARWEGKAVDLADVESIDEVATSIIQNFGHVDILVNVAAIRPHERLEAITPEAWDRVFAVNVRAPFLLAQRFMPRMMHNGWGRIINVSGIDAWWGKVNRAHVSSSKAAVDGLSRVLAAESGGTGVTVNTIVPGVIDTAREPQEWWPDLQEFYRLRLERIPMQRLGQPTEVADCCLFLVSDLCSYMTGQSLFVSGGAFPMVKRE